MAYWPSVAGWEFTQNNNKDQWQPGGTTWYVRNYLKRQFRYCPVRIGARIQTMYPWIYLPFGAIAFAGVAIAAWKWRLPTGMKVAYTAIALILVLLLTFALPVTFEAGPVTIS